MVWVHVRYPLHVDMFPSTESTSDLASRHCPELSWLVGGFAPLKMGSKIRVLSERLFLSRFRVNVEEQWGWGLGGVRHCVPRWLCYCTTCSPAPLGPCPLHDIHGPFNITSSSSPPATHKPTNAYPPALFPAKNARYIVISSITFYVRYRVYNSLPSGPSLQPVEFGAPLNTSIYRVFRKYVPKSG